MKCARLLVHLSLLVFTSAQAPCYFPGGNWAEGYYPCNPKAFTTHCCRHGWTCESNGLCVVTHPDTVRSDLPRGTSFRGACTNPLWNNTVCGGFCLNDPVSDNSGKLSACGDNKFCCGPDEKRGLCDCKNGKGTFSVPDGVAQTIIGIAGLVETQTPAIPVSRPTAVATSTLSTATISATSSSTSNATATPSPIPKKSVTPGARAGIAIGVILFLAIAGFLGYRRVKRNRRHHRGRRSAFRGGSMAELNRAYPHGGIAPDHDPYQPVNPNAPPQDPPTGPSRSEFVFQTPADNPYERNAPSRTTTPAVANGTIEQEQIKHPVPVAPRLGGLYDRAENAPEVQEPVRHQPALGAQHGSPYERTNR